MRDQNEIVKLITKDNREVFVSIVKQIKDNHYRVKILKQPIYEIATTKHCTSLFQQFCHEDDIIDSMLMQYDCETMTIEVYETMLKSVTNNELVDLLKHFNYTSFGDFTKNKSDRDVRLEKLIISEALGRLYTSQS